MLVKAIAAFLVILGGLRTLDAENYTFHPQGEFSVDRSFHYVKTLGNFHRVITYGPYKILEPDFTCFEI